MKRTISKRVTLNEKEAETLRIKARQMGVSETAFLREVIMGSQPMEAPPRQFYEAIGYVYQLAWEFKSLVDQIQMNGFAYEQIEPFYAMHTRLNELLLEIKQTMENRRFYALSAYEIWVQQKLEKEGKGEIPPEMHEYIPRDRSTDICDPSDPDLGWNALGIEPPFLAEAAVSDPNWTEQHLNEEGESQTIADEWDGD